MKKIFIFLALFMVLLSGCSNNDDGAINIVSASDVIDTLDDNANIVVIIGQTTCAACIQYKPVLDELLTNYDFDLMYVELDKDNNSDLTELVDNYLIEASATPTTYVFKEGVRVDMFVGYMDYRTTKSFLERNGVIE